ncbi:Imm1 family immunity protein [Lentzea californiensis]|uniref:Imm1 family immunity protein n=1 Tax=Lentzea californiensis TaxID=438851 RepID=UPI002164D955|nr:Imm1 family immunity protein [Lentzea californiensis]MCR3746114.1 Immunity protein Imm1 [Lentzea californiensis]
MATLEIWYDQKPDNDFGAGDPSILVTTHEELAAFIDRVSERSAAQPCPSLVEVSIAEDPYGFPTVYAGIGSDQGYVRISGVDDLRATQGDLDATGDLVYDFQGHETLVPASYEVPLDTVRSVLAAYLDHGGLIPADFPHLASVG